jgi:hypothetical protein
MSDAAILDGVVFGVVDTLLVRIKFVLMVWTVGRWYGFQDQHQEACFAYW